VAWDFSREQIQTTVRTPTAVGYALQA
jgi:hypothetical protein